MFFELINSKLKLCLILVWMYLFKLLI